MIRKMRNQKEKKESFYLVMVNYHLRIEIDLVRISVAEALNMFDQLSKLNQSISADDTHRLLVNNSRRYDKS